MTLILSWKFKVGCKKVTKLGKCSEILMFLFKINGFFPVLSTVFSRNYFNNSPIFLKSFYPSKSPLKPSNHTKHSFNPSRPSFRHTIRFKISPETLENLPPISIFFSFLVNDKHAPHATISPYIFFSLSTSSPATQNKRIYF